VLREAAKNAKWSEFRCRKNFPKQRRGKAMKSFFFAFFAASREENLLSKFAPKCGCTRYMGVRKAQLVSAKHAIARPRRGRAMACFAGFIN
jgi:hypothetical protein